MAELKKPCRKQGGKHVAIEGAEQQSGIGFIGITSLIGLINFISLINLI